MIKCSLALRATTVRVGVLSVFLVIAAAALICEYWLVPLLDDRGAVHFLPADLVTIGVGMEADSPEN